MANSIIWISDLLKWRFLQLLQASLPPMPGKPPPFLTSILDQQRESITTSPRPHVTLTFAQSLDSKIAGQNGRQLILSGNESMQMTHWMRTMHDAILVGIGTALNDDPQLNTRHLPPIPNDEAKNEYVTRTHLPRPIILDSQLRLSPTCKLLTNFQRGHGRRPWVVGIDPECSSKSALDQETWDRRSSALETAEVLHLRGINTLMVEGGAQIINSFFVANSSDQIIDTIIMTLSPIFVGAGAVSYSAGADAVTMNHLQTIQTL
ncbi:dihydrofolate reductase-like domain-containing protein [Infundibulicybe gibba]|nr:dihydrofolate reductase-like domain-containing protein [Infundibulicybe gibba]